MSEITHRWVDILLPFTGRYGSRMTGTEIARLSRVPQQTVSRHLNNLVRDGIIEYVRQGRNKLYYFDHSKHGTRSINEILENSKGIMFQQKASKAFTTVNDIKKHAETVVVFGSYSSHSYGKSSDLDILILGKCDKAKIKKVKQRHTIQINEHYASYKELEKLLREKNPLATEILGNHVIFGNVSKVVKMFIEVTA